jgi:hypothetical protein
VNNAQKKWFLFRQTCLVVLLAALPLVYLGFLVPLPYIFVGVVFIIICILILRQRAKKQEKLCLAILDKTFESFQRPKPTLKILRGHGFPHFTVTFQSEDDMNVAQASGHLNKFKSEINELCGHYYDGKKKPFNVEWAVYATYVGRRYFPT